MVTNASNAIAANAILFNGVPRIRSCTASIPSRHDMVDTLPGRAGAAQVGQVLSDVGFALQSLSLAW
ncbi:hypothetical protein [Xanthomonas campestris]|uniref:hypothetical protein n=1 Tax=Xanthomonas campestris TaxID=339 RepID=UPI0038905C1B